MEPAMTNDALERAVAQVRAFNRFYTQRIGALDEELLDSPFSLAQVRVLWEIAHRRDATAGDLARALGLDPGYLSRILATFKRRGLLARTVSAVDRRRQHLALTRKGARAFAPLDRRSHDEVAALLRGLAPQEQQRLLDALRTVESLLGERVAAAPYLLRPHRPGDIGWVVSRHGALYHEEYGWDQTFEALVAEIAAKFLRTFDAQREHCWIAERDGVPLGSVFCVAQSRRIAKLRLLLVEPAARGSGLGAALVAECIRFARSAGYRTLTLWTNDVLVAARRIYERFGFRLVRQEPHHSFGHDLVGQYWELPLR
jgi:DNA-binding MarR family transcriptional regulator/N-acetylglutamate synthase-like GNAT family acetyltransferase